jgi:branched-chain amino acid transport system ATP-binding protein
LNASAHDISATMSLGRMENAGASGVSTVEIAAPLRAEGLTVTFGGLTAVKDLDLDVQTQEIHALIGPNGAGKTTAVNALSGFVAPTSGRVWVNGATSRRWRSHTIAKAGLARTFQNIRLFGSMTVLETVLVGAHTGFTGRPLSVLARTRNAREEERQAVEEARRLIDFVGLPRTTAQQLANSLSYGHQRRVELARALISHPKVLLLDEPLAGMNLSEKVELTTLVRQIRDGGVAILLIEHDMDVIRNLANRVTVLHQGRKLAEGTPDAVLGHEDVQAAYLGKAK